MWAKTLVPLLKGAANNKELDLVKLNKNLIYEIETNGVPMPMRS